MSEQRTPPKFVYDFTEGNKDLKDLLGGKGANLAEMTNLGLPVPPGFTITTEACKVYLESGARAGRAARRGRARTSTRSSRRWASSSASRTTRCWSRCAPGRSSRCPGMMETVLNIGLSDASVAGLAAQAGRRALRLGLLPPAHPDVRQDRARRRRRPLRGGAGGGQARQGRRRATSTWTPADLQALVEDVQGDRASSETGRDFPQDPREQMDLAVRAVFDSWNTDRAKLYRRQERIPGDLGTAVNICSMVFGNLGPDSGTGVAFTRDPASGHAGRLRRLPAERAGRGRRRRHPQHRAARRPRGARQGVLRPADARSWRRWRTHYRDLCDIEFTIERGKLWMLQTRVGKRTAAAAFRIATQLVDQGLIDEDEALQRVNGAQLAQLMFPRFDDRRQAPSCSAGASPPRRARRSARRSSTRTPRSSGRAPARRSSWSAARPTPTTSTA